MKSAIFFLVAATLWWTGCSTPNTPDETKRLEGTYFCESAVINGKRLPEQKRTRLRLTLTDKRYRTEDSSEVLFDSTYKLDQHASPKQISMVGTEGDLIGKEALGIYSLQANKLRICYTMPGKPRPTSFESPAGSGAYFLVWRR